MVHPRKALSRHGNSDASGEYDFGGRSSIVDLYAHLRKKVDAKREPMIH